MNVRSLLTKRLCSDTAYLIGKVFKYLSNHECGAEYTQLKMFSRVQVCTIIASLKDEDKI